MSEIDVNIYIYRLLGWELYEEDGHSVWKRKGVTTLAPAQFTRDLNAIHEAEQQLLPSLDMRRNYFLRLEELMVHSNDGYESGAIAMKCIFADAETRCRALINVFKKQK